MYPMLASSDDYCGPLARRCNGLVEQLLVQGFILWTCGSLRSKSSNIGTQSV